jgi:hypothetical protein
MNPSCAELTAWRARENPAMSSKERSGVRCIFYLLDSKWKSVIPFLLYDAMAQSLLTSPSNLVGTFPRSIGNFVVRALWREAINIDTLTHLVYGSAV